ncbi:sensor histidine kinase [Fodinicurvata sediminis]|uniref:sensor histidine kinase n=1 Tax=Fodinicurvata sediminis TaxID=1121832 RepID=UPI0003B3C670|nr:PAS domain-containing sensor histidine kinase [Fodinicurvata sediminis]
MPSTGVSMIGVPERTTADADAQRSETSQPSGPAEGRSEDFLRASAEWLWETDSDLRLTYVSAPVARGLGRLAHKLVGEPLLSLFSEAEQKADEQSRDRLHRAVEARRPFRNLLFHITSPDGEGDVISLCGVAYFDEATGRYLGYRGTAAPWESYAINRGQPQGRQPVDSEVDEDSYYRLIQEMERLAIEVSELRYGLKTSDQQDEEDESETERLARLAHELRSPLNAIMGYADFATKSPYGPLPSRYLHCLQSISAAASHLQRVITTFVEEKQPEEERQPRSEDELPLAEIVAEVAVILSLEAERAGVNWSNIGPVGPWMVKGDRRAIAQILINLLGNAIKFTPKGRSVGLKAEPLSDEQLAIVIWDEGVGIPKDELERIFEAGYRSKQRKDHIRPGRGLGLAIAQDLAHELGGDIVAESTPGQGSRFVVTLPRVMQEQTASSANDEAEPLSMDHSLQPSTQGASETPHYSSF